MKSKVRLTSLTEAGQPFSKVGEKSVKSRNEIIIFESCFDSGNTDCYDQWDRAAVERSKVL